MRKSLKEPITALHALGRTYKQIQEELGCSRYAIDYHLKPESAARWRKSHSEYAASGARRKREKEYLSQNPRVVLKGKIREFCLCRGRRSEGFISVPFTADDLLAKWGPNPKCFYSGRPIELGDPSKYALDHYVPVSRGGHGVIGNAVFCCAEINQSKHSLLTEEYHASSAEVLRHAGWTVIAPTPQCSTENSES